MTTTPALVTTPDYIPRAWLADLDTVRLARIDLDLPHPLDDAREFASAASWDWHLDDDARSSLVLVVDELVANVIRWARRPLGWHVVPVRVEVHSHRIVVEVDDADPTLPAWRDFDVDHHPEDALSLACGLGGPVLAELCESVGARRSSDGKTLRAVISIPDPRTIPTDDELRDMYREHFGVQLLDAVVEAVR